MIVFAVRHRETLRFWTGLWTGWSTNEADAKTFACSTDAFAAAYGGCNADPAETQVVTIQRVSEQEIEARNDSIVTALADRWLRQG